MADLTIATVQASPTEVQTPLLVLQLFERDKELSSAAAELDARTEGLLSRVLQGGDVTGKKDETLPLYPPPGSIGAERVMLVGVGKRADYTLERLRRAVGSAIRQAEKLGVRALALLLEQAEKSNENMDAEVAARGAIDAAILAAWDFREYKSAPAD